jgi:transcriptional regulator with XRE-family HTH domain
MSDSRLAKARGKRMIQDLRELRIMAGLTQCDVAKETGLDRSKLSLAENQYVELRPEEKAAVRTVLLKQIETRATQLRRVLSDREAVVV